MLPANILLCGCCSFFVDFSFKNLRSCKICPVGSTILFTCVNSALNKIIPSLSYSPPCCHYHLSQLFISKYLEHFFQCVHEFLIQDYDFIFLFLVLPPNIFMAEAHSYIPMFNCFCFFEANGTIRIIYDLLLENI